MQDRARTATLIGMPMARMVSSHYLGVAVAYLAGYALLDRLSYVYGYGNLNITPWNPPTGLSLALILLFGRRFLPWVVVAPAFGDLLVRGLPLPASAEIASVLIIGGGYAAAATLLLSPRLSFDATLSSRRSLLLLGLVAAGSAALVAAAFVGMLTVLDIVPAADFARAGLRFWVGDVIGIAVLTPFLLVVATRRRWPRLSWELVGLHALILLALWMVFGVIDAYRFQVFYILFLPIVWTAVRFGLEGVTGTLLVAQLGLMAVIHFTKATSAEVTAYQALMVVLAFTGLAVGVLITEQQRTERRLRLNEEALNRSLRLNTMGEFAAALAHEINQPLAAMANYARVLKDAAQPGVAAEAAEHIVKQVDRAGEVVRRLRDLIRLGRGATEVVNLPAAIDEALLHCGPELDRQGVRIDVHAGPDLPEVAADPLQLQQVLINLMRNSVEALAGAGRRDGRIGIEARPQGAAEVLVSVRDDGPGFAPDVVAAATTPFATTKAEGLGLGLALARSIVEAHGGRLSIDSDRRGAVVAFSLPVAAAGQGTA